MEGALESGLVPFPSQTLGGVPSTGPSGFRCRHSSFDHRLLGFQVATGE